MNDLFGMDLIPEPKIICAALRACRKINDYSLTVRYLEALQMKCRTNKDLWPYVVQVCFGNWDVIDLLRLTFPLCDSRKKSRQSNEVVLLLLKEIKPTLDELGANLPAELGYDKPELALQSVFDVHG